MTAEKKICVSIADDDLDRALAVAVESARKASVLEIRLDALTEPVVAPFVEKLDVPLLFTCRPEWEGGFFAGSEDERFALLEGAVKGGATYVDMELRADEELRRQLISLAKKHDVKVLISWHDFKNTSSAQALQSIFQAQYRSGANIGKIVTTARSFQDVLRVLNLQVVAAEMGFPLCAFCMGRTGMISRIATVELGGFMTYAAPDTGKTTAPGQLPVSDLLEVLECFDDEN